MFGLPVEVFRRLISGHATMEVKFVGARSRLSPDGKTFTRLRFSTPTRDDRDFGPARLGSYGEAPDGDFTYREFERQNVTYNER